MRVAVLFPSFLGGGAEAVCAWILEALKDKDVTLITFSDISLRELDVQYGTDLAGSRMNVHVVPLPLPTGLREKAIKSLSGFSFRQFYLSWYYRRYLSNKFDIGVSAFNEMDLGAPSIQYIHMPMFGRGHEILRPVVGHSDSFLRRMYKEMLRLATGWSEERVRNNLTLTNSCWTAGWIEKIYNIKAKVVYPPVVWNTRIKSWDERENGFLLVSRIVREKKIEKAIKILMAVRQCGFDVHLRILGGVGDVNYFRELKKEFGMYDWILWEKRLERNEYEQVLARYKYGIHVRENEQFGIGVAEMVRAGIIPFVPAEGGQAEIVDNHSLLTWTDDDEAAHKIVQVLKDKRLQNKIRRYLIEMAIKFSAENFIHDMQQVVKNFYDERQR